MSRVSAVVRSSLGVFLLAAAMAKAYRLFWGTFADDLLLSSPRLQFVAIEVEFIVGLWLLSGWRVRIAQWAAMTLFLILGALSLFLALAGQQSCGCFGEIAINPWITLSIDVVAIILLAICLRTTRATAVPSWRTNALATLGGALGFLALILGVFTVAARDPNRLLSRLRGEMISVEPGVVSVGTGAVGDVRTFAVTLTNQSDESVTVCGGTASCTCLATSDLPLTIPPGQSRAIHVTIAFRGTPGLFQHRYAFYVEHSTQRMVISRFAGQVVGPTG